MTTQQMQDEGPTPLPTADQRMCPILSAGLLMREKPVVAEPGKMEVTACKGVLCAFFLPIANEKGVVVSGGCGVAALPSIVSQLNAHVAQAAKLLTLRAVGEQAGTRIIPA